MWLPVSSFIGLLTLVAIAYADDVRKGRDRGLTSEASILMTFLLGALASSTGVIEPMSQRVLVVAALAVIVTFLLSSKPRLHALVGRVSNEDLYATVRFLIVAVLVLPLLPNTTVGPLDVINPFHVGLMVVFIAGISFVGYVATRVLGTGRGLVTTALLGGLVSSTAVTLSFAGRARKEPALVPLAAAAIVLASTIMFARILVEVAVLYRPLLRHLTLPVTAMAAAGIVVGAILFRRAHSKGKTSPDVPLSNPFELGVAIRFGLVFGCVLLASKAAQIYAGPAGMYAASALAGTTDVDAITLSTANMARDGLDAHVATTTIVVGAVSNTIVKAAMTAVLGGWNLGKLVLIGYGAMLVAAAVTGVALWFG
jgi:uncharacterized membrane protein (DUF4010 family)